ncbi:MULTISPECIES: aminotransferase class I/II-fold pyridoxal phosphate-dependent enzyme [Mammaliicoccus]|uniref:aminotransferase class I/II-fold pyridoxal phosphate-dependent enzyme n=1 Tax=Mammaliicoccus TaxID=2803850 RepID=UPI000DFC8A35|nr:aminotransferase class I/II-fold pyridoxal phosphate-dependent enzyme [Mammaliicoccus fleurettii]MEB7806731.1 aminotransferase class I/II-fold pyridoxal phosphate-dependent enzyme [Mammaliicoccus fleurettii]RTX91020.1 aminotransferase class I/II-fold pyridoxal phosphate-dependent enzyme [Mammaliicoccus fleurettii]SUM35909.1 putative aminotransferase [Mammaliicoccus fleurettii]HCN61732.1 N-succinyldiaminopimelate aminotransferase [Staphylococcus sp.]
MPISKLLSEIPDSYFGKTMGRKVEHGPLPLINMAVGIPDGETPKVIVDEFINAIQKTENQKYGAFHGKDAFKQAIVDFYKRHYDVTLDKEEEVCILFGTKNGLVELPLCVVEPDDYVLLPNPGYTDYLAGVLLARAKPYSLELTSENHYLPIWDNVEDEIIDKTKLIYLTYPNNPTGSVASKQFFDDTINRFKNSQTNIVHDFAYSAFGFDKKNPSILQSEGAKDTAIEVYSLSKGYNMSGYRVGFAVGNKEMIAALKKYQTHTHAGMFGALQDASTVALNECDDFLIKQNEIFKNRRNKFEASLREANLPFEPMKGGIFLWLQTPPKYDGEAFVEYLLKEQSILVAPGIPFGDNGKDYVRISLALSDSELSEGASRLQELAHLYK